MLDKMNFTCVQTKVKARRRSTSLEGGSVSIERAFLGSLSVRAERATFCPSPLEASPAGLPAQEGLHGSDATAAAAVAALMARDPNAQEEPGQRGSRVAVGAHAAVSPHVEPVVADSKHQGSHAATSQSEDVAAKVINTSPILSATPCS